MAASARKSGEITHRRDGRAEIDGYAATAIATRQWAAQYYARVPALPFTTRSLTRAEHQARGHRIAAGAATAYGVVIALLAFALLDEGESSWMLLLVVGGGLALGTGPLVLLATAQAGRSRAYRDPRLIVRIAADRFTAHAAAVPLIDAPWRELRLVDLVYDKAGMRYGFVVELSGVVLEHDGKSVTIDPAWVMQGRAAATAIVTQLIAARRLAM